MTQNVALAKVYDPKEVESEMYALWEQAGAFRSKPDDRPHEKSYCIVIPPPNVTGALHLGHALNNTLQDILIRYHRMRGFNTLWQPGTDHAGIATQAVVERRIREQEGKTRHELGREELVKRIWAWKDGYERRIIEQLKLMGCSCDWSRNRFTLDEGLSKAVRHMFFKLFKDGLIFRGKRLVNWDTQLQTAVSDDEVYYEKVQGHFWYFKYPVISSEPRTSVRADSPDSTHARNSVSPEPRTSVRADSPDSTHAQHEISPEPQASARANVRPPAGPEYVVIATTRPETMLGDTAVAVHPDPEGFFQKKERELQDALDRLTSRSGKEAAEIQAKLDALAQRRERDLPKLIRLRDMAKAGRKVLLPLVERQIPLITDEWADPTLGTGCVKITPAHDPNDYEVGLRHNLPMINVLTPDGKVAPIIEADPSAAPVNPGTNENAHSDRYADLTFASDGRARVVADMEARGLVEKVEDHDVELGHSDRSKLPIEPFLSDQWFIRTGEAPEPQASACANPPDSGEEPSSKSAEPRASARANTPDSTTPQQSSHLRPRSPDLSFGATLLTWTTYGTWLPGDDRGSVSRAPRVEGTQSLRNLPGEPYDRDDPHRQAGAMERMEGKPVRLTAAHAPIVLSCIAESCERHGIELLAAAVMANHVHVLCQGKQHGAEMLQLIKGSASRRLNEQFALEGSPRWWTKSGSRRRIRGGSDLTDAIEYVKSQEYPLLIWSFDVNSGEGARLVNEARRRVHDENAGTPESRTFAQAEACGSGEETTARTEVRGSLGLAQMAIEAVQDGRIQVFPPRYAKSYLDWLSEKRDWCISRQLWWGHRIPVWHVRLSLSGENAWDEITLRSIDHALLGELRNASAVFVDPATGNILDTGIRRRSITRATDGTPIYEIDMGRFDSGDLQGDFDVYICDQEGNGYWEKKGFNRDPDVLDTWFSSALWPFSTLGWPEETEHLKQYYPTSVLCTSRDIITNWVARMVMFGLYAMGKIPFDHVYIHPKILDGRGETMSKSKGNGVDPEHIIHSHGADAMRYSLADMTTETQDIRMPVEYVCPHCGKLTEQATALKAEEQARKSRGQKLDRGLQPADCIRVRCTSKECGREFATQWADDALKQELGIGRETSEKFDIGRNFCNKLWNAARFALMNLEEGTIQPTDASTEYGITARAEARGSQLLPEDRWILARLSQTIRRYHQYVQGYQFSASVKELRDFFWDSLCDWYIELVKPRLSPEPQASACANLQTPGDSRPSRTTARQVLAFCMDQVLRLWHPTIPFITERLWRDLNAVAPRRGLPGIPELASDPLLATASFPPVDGYPQLDDDQILDVFAEMQDVVRGVRDLRSRCGVSPKESVRATVVLPQQDCPAFEGHAHIVIQMANLSDLRVDPRAKRPPNAGSVTFGSMRVFVHDISDDQAERQRTTKALQALEKQISGKEAKLANEKFAANAPADVVEAERQRLADLVNQRDHLREHLSSLEN